MDWQIIAQVFGGLLVLVVGYAYVSDKKHIHEQLKTLSDRVDKLSK